MGGLARRTIDYGSCTLHYSGWSLLVLLFVAPCNHKQLSQVVVVELLVVVAEYREGRVLAVLHCNTHTVQCTCSRSTVLFFIIIYYRIF